MKLACVVKKQLLFDLLIIFNHIQCKVKLALLIIFIYSISQLRSLNVFSVCSCQENK